MFTRKNAISAFFLGLVVFLNWSVAHANTNPAVTYDARSAGLGGTGVAYANTAAAVIHNPAGIIGIKQLSFNATFTPYGLTLKAPFDLITGKEERTSSLLLSPYSELSLALRLHERVVIGAAGLLTFAAGGKFTNIPFLANNLLQGDVSLTVYSGEIRIPLAIELTDWLVLGAAYRISYASQSTTATITSQVTQASSSENLSGWNYAGVQAGVLVRPFDGLSLGANYLSKITIDVNGDTKVNHITVSSDEANTVPEPHTFVLGASLQLLDKRLLLVGEAKYLMFKNAYADKAVKDPAYAWQDAQTVAVGAELLVLPIVPVRVGYNIGRQATPDTKANPLIPAPGLAHFITAGTGLRLPQVAFDIALSYAREGGNVTDAATPGDYIDQAYIGSLSATIDI